MSLTINTNMAAVNTRNNIIESQSELNKSLERLSTGLRINSAKDDTAGLMISERMTAQIQGMDQAVRNSNDAISITEVSESALQTVNDSLLRIREIAVQSINDTNSVNDREALQLEVNQLLAEVDNVIDRTQFNNSRLFDGSFTSKDFQVGPNSGDIVTMSIPDINLGEIGNYQIQTINTEVNQGTGSARTALTSTEPDTANSVNAQTLFVNGEFGTTVLSVALNESAEDIASTFTGVQQSTGIRASAETKATLDGLSTDGTVTMEIANSDMAAMVSISATVSISDLSGLVTELNNKSGQTGITAELGATNSEMILTQAKGKNIVINDFGHSTNGATIDINGIDGEDTTLVDGDNTILNDTDDSTVVTGIVTLKSDAAFAISSSEDDVAGSIFDTLATEPTQSTLETLDSINVSTQVGSEDALDIVDSALENINKVRADVGAMSNRFESIINHMTRQSENLQVAQSRIRDADFAQETTALARSQILVQAGIAILSQANAQQASALSLLQA